MFGFVILCQIDFYKLCRVLKRSKKINFYPCTRQIQVLQLQTSKRMDDDHAPWKTVQYCHTPHCTNSSLGVPYTPDCLTQPCRNCSRSRHNLPASCWTILQEHNLETGSNLVQLCTDYNPIYLGMNSLANLGRHGRRDVPQNILDIY